MPRAASHRLRTGRFSHVNLVYIITTSTRKRQELFRNLEVGRAVVGELIRVERIGLASTLAYVVMPDHLHWLMQLGSKATLAETVQSGKGRSSRGINQMLCRKGPVWQTSFHDRAVRSEEDLHQVARYVVANPVRAGIVERLEDYSLWDARWL